ncbi:peptidoglycan hydrolase-like protein with peptidoglycan-binding domain [Catenulispora sp. EB89]|uniref:peptidoglycan-binding domain-containing protein n=1 Tax=Catenulispora sp. EB89 TaxID=3156257 RepID=UPI0035186EA3
MANLSLALPMRRRFVAVAVGVLAIGGGTLAATAPAQAATSNICGYTNAQPQLYVGSQGVAVEQAQCEIDVAYAFGHSTDYGSGPYNGVLIDGDFGRNTEAAVKNFQIHCMGATNPDGIIGPNTWERLDEGVDSGHFC